jgi:DHA1 family multidrug resistance protein-like MFS transporter
MDTTKRKNILILAFTLVVVMLGYGMVIPIMPFYIEELGAGGTELGLLVASYALMRLIFAPIWGSLSDRFGRKPVLTIGVFGYAVAMLLFGLSTELWMLFAARILSGILSSATGPTTMAYVSDSTTEEQRGGGMGILGGALGLGMILGPGLGGWLGGDSIATPFFLAAGLSMLSVFLILFLLPESLPPAQRPQTRGKITILNTRELWQGLMSPIGIMLLLAFLVAAGLTIFYGVFGLYALQRFNYGTEEVGYILMVIGLVSAVGQGVLAGPFTKRFGDAAVIKGALLASVIGFGLMLLANDFISVLLTTGFFILATALMTPAITSLTSKRATGQQGVAMGLSSSSMSLGRIVGPLWGGIAFDINYLLPYLSGAVVMCLTFLVSLVWLPKEGKEAPTTAVTSSARMEGR